MPDFRWFEAAVPRGTSLIEATAMVRVLANRPQYGLRRLQPVVVFELWLHSDGVHWLVGIEAQIARTLPDELQAQMPGLVLTPVSAPHRPKPITAREIRFSSLAYPLRLDTAPAITAGLLQTRRQLHVGEAICVQFVVGPGQRFHRLPVQQTPLDVLGFTTPRQPDTSERQAFKQKLTEPLLGVRGRIGAVAGDSRRAGGLTRPALSALSLANGAHARVSASQQSSRTATQLTKVFSRARTWSGIVNATELAALVGWCIDGLDAPDLPSGFDSPPPELTHPPRPASATRLAGTSTHTATKGAAVRLPFPSYAAHLHVIGPPGVGKSTLLANWIVSEAAAGRSVVVIEPKGDLINDVLTRLPAGRHDDLVVIDPGSDASLPVVGVNPLAGHKDEAERRADSLLHLFRELFGTAIGPRSGDVLLHALIIAARLPDGALTDVLPLLTNAGFRRWAVDRVGDPLVINPWVAWFDSLSDGERAQVVAPIANKVRVFSSRPSIRRLLGQPEPRFSVDSIFTTPRVVLINLNAGAIGSETSKIIGSLVLSQLWEAIQRQTTRPEHLRQPVAVVVDEWQDFVAGLDFADVLARARGAKVPFTVAHQHLDQLTPNLRAAVLANARSRVVFRPAEGDVRALAKVLGGSVTPEGLERLPAFHAVGRMLVDGAPSRAFEVVTPPLDAPSADADALRRASSERFGVAADELDAAILHRWQGAAPGTPVGARRKRP